MGVSLGTNRMSIDMGCGSFQRFRTIIAHSYDYDFGETYEKYLSDCDRVYFTCPGREQERAFGELDKKFNEYIAKKNLPDGLLDFLLQSDCKGKVDYKTARILRDVCRKSESKEVFGYVFNQMNIKEIAEIFDDGVKHRCCVWWG